MLTVFSPEERGRIWKAADDQVKLDIEGTEQNRDSSSHHAPAFV